MSLAAREGSFASPVSLFCWMVLVGSRAGRRCGVWSCYKECFISTGVAPRAGGEREWVEPRWKIIIQKNTKSKNEDIGRGELISLVGTWLFLLLLKL